MSSGWFYKALSAIVGRSEAKAFRVNEIEEEVVKLNEIIVIMQREKWSLGAEKCPASDSDVVTNLQKERFDLIIDALEYKKAGLAAEAESM